MKTPTVLSAAFALFCFCPPAGAEDAQGLDKEEMTKLYGEDFAKEAMDARSLMDEEWDEDTIDEDAVEEGDAPAPAEQAEPAAAGPQPVAQKVQDAVAPQAARAAEETAAREAAREAAKARALRKKLLESTVALVKSKRSVDAKIRSSRNSIDQQRAKIAAVQEKLEKKRDKAFAKNDPAGWGRMANDFMEQHPEWRDRMPGGQGGGDGKGNPGHGGRGAWGMPGGAGGRGGRGRWGAPALPQPSTQDRQTVKNAQKSIKELKKAVPQLVVLSYQMSERIESQLATLGDVQNAVLRSYDPASNPEKEGCETEQAPEDSYKPR
ncbi:MAG: hypothetical protein Q4C88_07045 [Akkermansia sp.]|nr:hypothetical protein [Akkermansia sp.]